MKKIYFTVTNDLSYDQRMHRICGSLAEHGYDVMLVGRKMKNSKELPKFSFLTKRINCRFERGKAFYFEYNIRLFFYLLGKEMDAICCIDLDTIIPGLWISKFKSIPRVYDAHELFTELKEVISRPGVQRTWKIIERYAVPQFKLGYTVSNGIAAEFDKRYKVKYVTIRNMPVLKEIKNLPTEDFILYQGWVNEARGLENLIPAMKKIQCKLVICGDGNFMDQLKSLITTYDVADKVELTGMISPDDLWSWTCRAKIGVAFPEKEGLNQYLALPNKFFDYIHAGLPQVTVNYPEYKQMNSQFDFAVLVENTQPDTIAEAVNKLLNNHVLYEKLKQNCLLAREVFQWKHEETKLLTFWKKIL